MHTTRRRPDCRIPVVFMLIVSTAFLVGCQSGPTLPAQPVSTPQIAQQGMPSASSSDPAQSPLPDPTVFLASTPALTMTREVVPSPDVSTSVAVTAIITGGVPAVTGKEPTYGYRVVNVFPHDPEAFTEGLVYVDGILYEGTGLDNESNPPSQSVLQKKTLENGQVLQGLALAPQYFGEGVTVLGDKVYQLTWRERTGFVYDKETLEPLGSFAISSDGWGLTHDGERLIRSDGTNALIFLDPHTLEETGRVDVRDAQGSPVVNLNELEYIAGEVFANVWLTDQIVRIDPATGQVLGWIDLTNLLPPEDRLQPVDVLNGIAYDAEQDRLFVTGKWWPKLFEIDLVAQGE